jgi:hypothetical protein
MGPIVRQASVLGHQRSMGLVDVRSVRCVGQPARPPTWIAVDERTCRLQDGPSRPDHHRQSDDSAQLIDILAGKWVFTAIVAIGATVYRVMPSCPCFTFVDLLPGSCCFCVGRDPQAACSAVIPWQAGALWSEGGWCARCCRGLPAGALAVDEPLQPGCAKMLAGSRGGVVCDGGGDEGNPGHPRRRCLSLAAMTETAGPGAAPEPSG